jgi:hypothetical protein
VENPKTFIERIHAMAKKNLENDGQLRAMAFLDGPGGIIICDINEMMSSRKAKDEIDRTLKGIAKAKAADAILFLSEIWMLKGDDTVVKEYMDNLDKYPNGVSDHPNRQEAVVFSYEARDGSKLTGMANILRSEGKPFLTELVYQDPAISSRGRFVNFFK